MCANHGDYLLDLRKNICYAKVEEYKRMKQRGDKDEDIAVCIHYQLKRISPGCDRYRQIFFWARQNLSQDILCRYGFGLTQDLPFPISMRTARFEQHKGKSIELYCLSTSEGSETSGE